MKPGLLQPALVRVSDDAAMTIRELTHAVKVVHRVYGPWPSLQAKRYRRVMVLRLARKASSSAGRTRASPCS